MSGRRPEWEQENYFSYFTEVEEHFAYRRGKNLLVSPLDWCLIELWRDTGIPLHVVLRGIDRSFESGRERRREPRSLFYCHPAVMEAFQEYQQAMLGSSAPARGDQAETSPEPVSRRRAGEFLQALGEQLRAQPGTAFQRAAQELQALEEELARGGEWDPRQLDQDLNRLGRRLAQTLFEEWPAERRRELRREIRKELKLYRRRVSQEVYRQLEANYRYRKVLACYGLSEFTLLGLEE